MALWTKSEFKDEPKKEVKKVHVNGATEQEDYDDKPEEEDEYIQIAKLKEQIEFYKRLCEEKDAEIKRLRGIADVSTVFLHKTIDSLIDKMKAPEAPKTSTAMADYLAKKNAETSSALVKK